MSSLIGWVHTQNDPWNNVTASVLNIMSYPLTPLSLNQIEVDKIIHIEYFAKHRL